MIDARRLRGMFACLASAGYCLTLNSFVMKAI